MSWGLLALASSSDLALGPPFPTVKFWSPLPSRSQIPTACFCTNTLVNPQMSSSQAMLLWFSFLSHLANTVFCLEQVFEAKPQYSTLISANFRHTYFKVLLVFYYFKFVSTNCFLPRHRISLHDLELQFGLEWEVVCLSIWLYVHPSLSGSSVAVFTRPLRLQSRSRSYISGSALPFHSYFLDPASESAGIYAQSWLKLSLFPPGRWYTIQPWVGTKHFSLIIWVRKFCHNPYIHGVTLNLTSVIVSIILYKLTPASTGFMA